jgi:hypothetical protein
LSTTSWPFVTLAEQRVVGRQPGVLAGDTKNWLPTCPPGSVSVLGHRHDALA